MSEIEFPLTPEQEAETSVPVGDIEELPAPTAADFLAGDLAQLLRGGGDEPVESVTGTVTAVEGDALVLGTREYSAGAGWEFALIKRPVTLPTILCEILATLNDGRVVRLMGKGVLWSDTGTGVTIPADQIVSYEVVS